MPTTPNPQLGYGKPTEATIDQVNIWMRGQPWYQEQMRQWGQDPGHPNLAKSQSAQILKMAQAQGVKVDEGNMEVDDHGNFNPVGHKLRNTLIVAGIAAAGIAAPYIIPAIAGAGGGGSAAAGLSAVEGGGFGIGSGTVAALGTGAMATVPVAAGTTAAGLTAGTLGSTVGVGGTGGGTLATAGRFLTSPTGSALVGTAGNIFSNIYGANKQADANTEAARLADEATKRAEQFSREQAEGGWQSNEHTQRANYDQWRARQDAIMGSLGHQLGINYTAPDYSPGIDPRYTGGAAAPAGPANAADPAQAFIANWQRTHDPKEGIEPLAKAYKAAGFGDRFLVDGTTPSNNELVVGGQKFKVLSGENGASPSWYIPGSNDGGAAPVMRPSLAATFVRPNFIPLPTPYQPGTLGAYVGS